MNVINFGSGNNLPPQGLSNPDNDSIQIEWWLCRELWFWASKTVQLKLAKTAFLIYVHS